MVKRTRKRALLKKKGGNGLRLNTRYSYADEVFSDSDDEEELQFEHDEEYADRIKRYGFDDDYEEGGKRKNKKQRKTRRRRYNIKKNK